MTRLVPLILLILLSFTGATMAKSVKTHVMFQGQADEAIELYASVFPEFEVRQQDRYEEGDMEGQVRTVNVAFAGHDLIIFNSPPMHDFTFTPAMSLFVEFDDAEELERAFDALSKDGEVAMPLGDYGFSPLFGWCQDRFGLSWQLSLANGQ